MNVLIETAKLSHVDPASACVRLPRPRCATAAPLPHPMRELAG
jgi:hypothetical protein